LKKCILTVLGLAFLLGAHARAQRGQILNAAELEIAAHKLNVLGSVLYVGAHPDDENSALMAYFSKGRKYRTAYLSVTRGEGGQNLIGSEKGDEIGLLRTQELLSARRIDGAEQFFTRAVDFGYSKTAQETFEFWGREKILGDIVWVIRRFRPDVIITRFAAEGSGGHGHHIASSILTRDAFAAAADPNRFPEQLKFVSSWKAKRLLWNTGGRPGPAGQEENKNRLRVDSGEYNSLLGKSYNEIGGESRSQHKSQGFGMAGRRGSQTDSFEVSAGDPAANDIFDGIDVSWNRVPGGQKVGALLAECLKTFDLQQPSKSIHGLLGAYAELAKLPDDNWVRLKKEEFLRVIQSCAGLWMEATAGDYSVAPGDSISIRTSVINRSDVPITLHGFGFPGAAPDSVVDRPLKNNEVQTLDQTVRIPGDFPISQPYWLDAAFQKDPLAGSGPKVYGLAENPPSPVEKIALSVEGVVLEYAVPLSFRWTDQVEGELYRPLEIRPRVTIQVQDKVSIFPGENPKKIKIRLMSHSVSVSGMVRIKDSDQWKVTPAGVPFSLSSKYAETEAAFDVTPPKSADEADLTVEAEVGGEKISRSLVEIAYPHIHRQVYFPESRIRAVKLDVKIAGKRIGYVMGAGDEVPEAIQNLGYDVVPLSDEMLGSADLAPYDAIVIGVRAYNTREALRLAKDRMLQYIERGGNLVVQYNVPSPQLANQIGPYPLTVGRDRVDVENAPVVFLAPDHPLLNDPNKITQKDFDGWVQERGLYFASQWDDRYETVVSCHDPGEPDKKGGLLYARYGKGVFIFTAYAWFRQLPAGVPGAFRIFANLISAGKAPGKPTGGKN